MTEKHVTIDDVARRAGLSVATVSRVMHDSPRVSPEARRRVREAVEALGYTPNALARGLAMRSTSHTIGVLVTSIGDLFWAEVARGIEDVLHQERYGVLIAGSYEDAARERSAIELFRHKRVDGIIVAASSAGPAGLEGDNALHLPVVFVNDEHVEPGAAESGASGRLPGASARASLVLVTSDDAHGAALAIAHLLELGHQSIAYIGPAGKASSLQRLQGYQEALRRAGSPAGDASRIALVGEGADNGELAAFRLLAADPAPTALFCYDDMTALGALRAVRALKLGVPGDVSVVGFDDIPLAAYLDPPLTTIRQPMYEMGRQAARLLLCLVRGEAVPPVVTMPGELVVRASSGAAPHPLGSRPGPARDLG